MRKEEDGKNEEGGGGKIKDIVRGRRRWGRMRKGRRGRMRKEEDGKNEEGERGRDVVRVRLRKDGRRRMRIEEGGRRGEGEGEG
jgi:hypothetical protein